MYLPRRGFSKRRFSKEKTKVKKTNAGRIILRIKKTIRFGSEIRLGKVVWETSDH